MAKPSLAELPAKLYALLSPLEPDERARVVQATLVLLGDEGISSLASPVANRGGTPNHARNHPDVNCEDAAEYFESKAPRNKGEQFAVAARFRELKGLGETHSKADIKKVITEARINFDDRNFARDINNAKRQAAFFNTGTGRDANTMSRYGQKYVDALPDRDAVKAIKRPKVGGNKKRSKKNAS